MDKFIKKILDNLSEKMQEIKTDKSKRVAFIMHSLPFILFFYLLNRLSWFYRFIGLDFKSTMALLLTNIDYAFYSFLISFNPVDLLMGTLGVLFLKVLIKLKRNEKKSFKKGIEHGSARWGNKDDIKNFMDNVNKDNNVLLSLTEGIKMNGKPVSFKYDRNKNVCIIGGSGSGKTRSFIKPNLMQRHSSYAITDPKGTVLEEVGEMLLRKEPVIDEKGNKVKDEYGKDVLESYEIKIFNLKDFSKSMHYNPLAYVKEEKDILKFVNVLIMNTKGEGDKAGEDFWVKAERLLLMALVGYLVFELKPRERNFSSLLKLINLSEAKEDNENYKNEVDLLFDEIENKDESFPYLQYLKYKQAAGKTAKSILISVGARLAVLDINSLRELTTYDEMELDKIGGYKTKLNINKEKLKLGDKILEADDKKVNEIVVNKDNIFKLRENHNTFLVERLIKKKVALFIITDDTDKSFNFLGAILYSQLFNLLCNLADNEFQGKLPVPVRCLLDEFANIGQIPDFQILIATIRSRLISTSIVLQAASQLKSIYKDHADTILGNCDSSIFLGGTEKTTLKELNETLGKETIDSFNESITYSNQKSHGQNYQKLGRDLMTRDELQVLDGGKCIVQIRGVRPFLSNKYDITNHTRYKYLDEGEKGKRFDVEKYVAKKANLYKNSYKDTSLKLEKIKEDARQEKENNTNQEVKNNDIDYSNFKLH